MAEVLIRVIEAICNACGGHDYVASHPEDTFVCRCCGHTIPVPK